MNPNECLDAWDALREYIEGELNLTRDPVILGTYRDLLNEMNRLEKS